jgi:hypothetical protein
LLTFSYYKAKKYKEAKECMEVVQSQLKKTPDAEVEVAIDEIQRELKKIMVTDDNDDDEYESSSEEMEC